MAIANTVHGGAATNTTTSATSLAITVAIAVGEFVWVTIATVAGNSTTAVSDNAAGSANKYQFFSKKVGASSEISCWFCYKAAATATTITATHAASRASGSASTYTGVLGVGQWKDATNAANNNTVTLTNALGSGNLTLAGMGDALGTQTWTAVTGTLRNNLAGGGSTTPGSTNIEGSTTTVAASLSVSVSGEAIAIELLSAVLPEAMDLDIDNSLAPPFMWSMGMSTLQYMYETEQFNWGFKQDISDYGGHESNIYDFPPAQQVTLPNEIEDEMVNWGYQPAFGGGGKQMMGFRGFWSLKAGMGSPDDWSFNSAAATPAITAFDTVDQLIPTLMANYFQIDGPSELEANTSATIGGGGTQQMGFRGYVVYPSAMVEAEAFGFDESRYFSGYETDYYDALAKQASYFALDGTAELEAITEDFISEMVSVDLQYVFAPQFGIHFVEDDQFGFQTAVVTVNQPWDGEDNLAVGWTARQEDEVFSQQPVFVQEEPVTLNLLPINLQSTDEDQLQSEFFASDRVPEDFEQFVVTNQLALYWNDDDASQSTFFSQEQYSDADEQFVITIQLPRQWSDDDASQSTFFASEQYSDNDEQLSPQARTVYYDGDVVYWPPMVADEVISPMATVSVWQQDDVFDFNTPEIEGELLLEEEIQLANNPYPLWQQVEDEQFGQNAPFLTTTSEVWELVQQPNPPYPVTHQVENDQIGQQSPFITSMPFDDGPEQLPLVSVVRDDMEQFSFQPEISEDLAFADEDHFTSFQLSAIQEDAISFVIPFATAEDGEVLQPRIIVQEEEVFGMNAPFLTSVPFDDQDQLPLITFVRDDVETWAFNPPVVTVVNPFDQDEIPVIPLQRLFHEEDYGQQVQFYADSVGDENIASRYIVSADEDSGMFGLTITGFTDQFDVPLVNPRSVQDDEAFGLNPPFITSVPFDDSPEQFARGWSQNDDVDMFGFNVPELLGELMLDEELEINNQPYPVTHQIENDQFGQNAPFITSMPFDDTDQMGQTWWVRDVDDSWAFNTPEIEGELLLEEEIQQPNIPYILWQQVEDEQFGRNAPFITSQPFDDALEQIGQTWWGRWQTEDEQFGQNAPFIVSIGFDDVLDQNAFTKATVDDVETFGFQPVFVQADIDVPLQANLVVAEDEVFGFQPEISEDLAFAEEDHFVGYQFINQTEDQFGMQAPFITSVPFDDFTDQLSNKPYPIVAEDDLVFPPSTILANMLYDADFNPTMQQSFYFGSEDLEKYNWGWLPPMTKVAEDDNPYDSRMQLQSYFVPEIEDEMFSWGFDNSRFYGLGDDAPYFTPAQMRSYYALELADEPFGFRTAVFTAFDQDELPPVGRMFYAEEEVWGFQFVFASIEDSNIVANTGFPFGILSDATDQGALTTGISLTPDEQWPNQGYQVQEEEVFGFNVPEVIGELMLDEEIQMANQPYRVVAEDDPFGFRPQIFIATDDSPDQLPFILNLRDDVEVFGFQQQTVTDLTFPDENVMQATRVNLEDVVHGQEPVFVESQVDSAVPLQVFYADLEQFGFEPVFVDDLTSSIFAIKLDTVFIEDDPLGMFVSTQPFSFGDEVEHLPNAPYPTTYQLENDQIGQQAPFIISQPFAWEESGIPSNPPWAVLDVTDYNDWISQITFVILQIYNVNIKSVLAVMAILVAQERILRDLDNKNDYGVNLVQALNAFTFREVDAIPRFTVHSVWGSLLSIT